MSSRQWAGEADPWSELNMNFKKLISERINNYLNRSKKKNSPGFGATPSMAPVVLARLRWHWLICANIEISMTRSFGSTVKRRFPSESFLEIALSLQLPGVNPYDNAEQVREAVETWLRTTSREPFISHILKCA